MPDKFLIIGLGNAENKYEGTRHNIGFEVVSALAETLNAAFKVDRYAYIAEATFKGRILMIIKPTTYMNLSGKAVKYWMDKEKIDIENILVIVDDIDLAPGQLRLRLKGGGGSHNGMNNIIEVLGHSSFTRLRFGIGKNYLQGYQIDYVLGRFDSEEFKTVIKPSINKAVTTIKNIVTIGIQRAMNICNEVNKNID